MNLDPSTRLKKSSFIQKVVDGDKAVIWHSLFGHPKIISSSTLSFLDIFSSPKTLSSVFGDYTFDGDIETILNDLIASYYLVPDNFNERLFLSERIKERESSIFSESNVNYLQLIISEACNFRCLYCMHFGNLSTSGRLQNHDNFMTFDIAKDAIDTYLAILKRHDKQMAEINFGGGEPILNWPVIAKVLHYCKDAYGRHITFRFSINTNASLITPEIAEKLKEYNVAIASSLDGLRDGNNLVRLTKSGIGTFDLIMQGFNNLATVSYPIKGVTMTINERNFPHLNESVIDWIAEQKMSEMRIDIDVINMVGIPIEDIVIRLMRVRGYAKKHNIDVAGFWYRPFENLNDSPLDTHVSFCGAVRGNTIYVSPTGLIYGCGYSTTQFGTLGDIDIFNKINGAYYRFVKERLPGEMKMCRGCMIEGQCGGGCNITQEFTRATKSSKLKRMCEYYRRMMQELLLEQLRADVNC